MPRGFDVDVVGTSDLINRISRFDKDVYKVLTREIRGITDDMRKDAQAGQPTGNALRNWGGWVAARDGRDLGFRNGAGLPEQMRVAVRKQTRAGVVGVVGKVLAPKNPAAAIFLLAKRGRLGEPLADKYAGTFPRGMTEAWRKNYAKAAERIDAAIDRARAAIIG